MISLVTTAQVISIFHSQLASTHVGNGSLQVLDKMHLFLEGARVEACSIAYLPTSEDHSDVYVFGMVRRAMKKRCVFCLAVFCECDAALVS